MPNDAAAVIASDEAHIADLLDAGDRDGAAVHYARMDDKRRHDLPEPMRKLCIRLCSDAGKANRTPTLGIVERAQLLKDAVRKAFQRGREALLKASAVGISDPYAWVTAATVVDHTIPHRGDQALFWDVSNWAALCKRHHDSDKQRIDKGGKPIPETGVDGWPKG